MVLSIAEGLTTNSINLWLTCSSVITEGN
jgi:hypothetical protein